MVRLSVMGICAVLAAVPLSAAGGDPVKGKAVFQQCGVCHAADTDQKKMGPTMKGLFKKEKLANGHKLSEAAVRAQIDGGGNGMPPYKDLLTPVQKDDLIAFLKTL